MSELMLDAWREAVGRGRCLLQGLPQPLAEGPYSELMDGTQTYFTHSRFNLAWFKSFNVEPHVIVDCGSFDGGDAYRFWKAFPRCRVISVEADPYRYSLVSGRIASTSIELVNAAVCEHDGQESWFAADEGRDAQGSLYRHSELYRRRFPNIKQAKSAQAVPASRIDTLCRSLGIEEISLLHMDIEGAEGAAIASLGEIRPQLIFLELCDGRFVGPGNVRNIHHTLCSMGYRNAIRLRHDSLYVRRATG